MPRTPIQVYPFVLVVVRQEDRFLLIQEAHRDVGTWFFPAGAVDPGEGIVEAAIRETREETGLDVKPVALLWMEDHTAVQEGVWLGRWRFILRAEMVDPSQQPGPTPDSLDARWFTVAEMGSLSLRSPEVIWICEAVLRGHPEPPLDSIYRKLG